jgi:phage terminase large subunit-like protein
MDVREIVSDPYEAEQLRQSLGSPDNFIVYPQTVPNLSPALKEMHSLVLSGRLHHNGNPVMRWMVGNVTAREDANENVFPRKDRPEAYIDGVSATLNAIGRAMAGQAPDDGGSYLDSAEILVV